MRLKNIAIVASASLSATIVSLFLTLLSNAAAAYFIEGLGLSILLLQFAVIAIMILPMVVAYWFGKPTRRVCIDLTGRETVIGLVIALIAGLTAIVLMAVAGNRYTEILIFMYPNSGLMTLPAFYFGARK